jgi:hypothetical protein
MDTQDSKAEEDSQENHNAHSRRRWGKEEYRYLYEIAFLFFYLLVDIFEIWPKSHFIAVFSFAIFFVWVSFVELPRKVANALSFLVVITGITIVVIAPPELPAETETWLAFACK